MLPSRLSHVLVIPLTLAVGPAFAQAQDCGAAEVATDARGRVRIAPAENPSEGCLQSRVQIGVR